MLSLNSSMPVNGLFSLQPKGVKNSWSECVSHLSSFSKVTESRNYPSASVTLWQLLAAALVEMEKRANKRFPQQPQVQSSSHFSLENWNLSQLSKLGRPNINRRRAKFGAGDENAAESNCSNKLLSFLLALVSRGA
jgi:hypothetical protein